VPFEVEDQLRKEGAIIERHEHITAIPNPYDIYGDNRWKDVLNKLFVFNMTHYERVLCLDADICLNKALTTFWDTPESWPEHGLAARSGAWEDHPSPPGHCKDELNSGFFLAVPSNHLFENLLQVKDFGDWDVEQVSLRLNTRDES
jgi:alpha-N-acetylglucosamine transferase